MSKLKISVPHQLDREEAKERLENFINILKEEFGGNVQNLQENWNDYSGAFSFKAMGFAVEGDIHIEPNSVTLEGSLPMAAIPFKGKIESTVRERLQVLLS